ncbi:hypothetical protein PSHT_06720 [Puccinia striiformis]|uniref:Uncharacterized protein n=1 Tax=Puccinia striiformis TaxID=27350 RepID=A0A2S4W3Q5_9BASI|nr:hypothetical protein PSHT_06720 [Puccinia striiformis]
MRAFAVQRIASRGFVCSLGSGMRGPGLFGRNTGRCGLARIEIGSCHVIQDYKECERTTLRYAQVVLRYKTQLVHQPRVSRRNITSNPPQHIHPHSKRRFDSCLTHATMNPSGGSTAWHCCGSIGSDVLPALLLRKQQCHGDEEAADNV